MDPILCPLLCRGFGVDGPYPGPFDGPEFGIWPSGASAYATALNDSVGDACSSKTSSLSEMCDLEAEPRFLKRVSILDVASAFTSLVSSSYQYMAKSGEWPRVRDEAFRRWALLLYEGVATVSRQVLSEQSKWMDVNFIPWAINMSS
jgi:hypothetical protein